MDAHDYQMIATWVLSTLKDEQVTCSPNLLEHCRRLMERSWKKVHPAALPSYQTHARTKEQS
jgi:hypothetical protein